MTSTQQLTRPDVPAPRPAPKRHLALRVALFALVGLLSAGVGVYVATRPHPMTTRQLMGLSDMPVKTAPDFRLVDQDGRPVTLGALRGRAVALYFMDPRCTDVCPIVAHEFVEADRLLGSDARRVALVGIDVNPAALAPSALRSFDAAHGLDHLHNWYFLTGSLNSLRQVWSDYSVSVQVDPHTGDVVHTTIMEFIDPRGRQRAIAAPGAAVTAGGRGFLPGGELQQWARGIADQLRSVQS